jgi:hypothetical protein
MAASAPAHTNGHEIKTGKFINVIEKLSSTSRFSPS